MGRTTDSDQLKQAQLCIPAPVPLLHRRNSFQLGLWLAELIIHHFFKMNYISERLWSLNEVTVSRRGRLKWKNANIRVNRHLDFAFHHSPQLCLLISPSNQRGPWAINPHPLEQPAHILHRLNQNNEFKNKHVMNVITICHMLVVCCCRCCIASLSGSRSMRKTLLDLLPR